LLVLAVVLEVVRSADEPGCAVPDCEAAPDCGADADCGESPDWPDGGTYIAGAVAPVPAQPASTAAAATASAHETGERLIDSCITGPHFSASESAQRPVCVVRARPNAPNTQNQVLRAPLIARTFSGTGPYEHVRYDGYLQRLQGYPLGPEQIDAFRREAGNHFGFIIYAHSRTGDDSEHSFLAHFSNATLTLPNGNVLNATQRVLFGPSADFYDVGSFREQRYTGSLTYRFAVSATSCPTDGTLQVRDGYGHAYRFPVDFSRYR
jgi:hypothetical protein